VVAVSYKEYQARFYNDFEHESQWGNSSSITDELAYSGRKSSATGDGMEYSAGLSCPLKIIPDSLKNTVDIEFMVYQSGSAHSAKVVMEAYGAFDQYWHGEDINLGEESINRWQLCRKAFMIPDSIKNADLIKIYVYNPSPVRVYIDDFRIRIN
jgi:hypothetical protein